MYMVSLKCSLYSSLPDQHIIIECLLCTVQDPKNSTVKMMVTVLCKLTAQKRREKKKASDQFLETQNYKIFGAMNSSALSLGLRPCSFTI